MTEQPPTRHAVLQGFPVRLWARQQAYYDELLREFNLILIGREQGGQSDAPVRLVQLAQGLTAQYGPQLEAITKERQDAFDRGDLTVDSHVPLVDETPEVLASVTTVLAEVDEYCRNGDLLTLAMPADLAVLRDWSNTQILRQYDGEPPSPWPGPLQ